MGANHVEGNRLLDDVGDGLLTGSGLKHLALWRGAVIDGVSDAGEVTSLTSHGIIAAL